MVTTPAQGSIILLEHRYFMIISRDYFNRTEQVIACPVIPDQNSYPSPVHRVINEPVKGTVFCEQMRYFDLSRRHYQVIREVPVEDLMEVSDIVQGLVEYQLY